MEPKKTNGPKIVKLLSVLKDLRDKEDAVLEEIAALAGDGEGIGSKLSTLYAQWKALWVFRYGSTYHFRFEKDAPAMKRLLRTFDVHEIADRMVTYITNPDPFYVQQRHPFGLFVATINQHTRVVETTDAAVVEGCLHSPRCTSDQQHTKQRLAEMR